VGVADRGSRLRWSGLRSAALAYGNASAASALAT